MKWMIASDIHGSAYYCRKLLEAYTEEGADRLLLLGDILYHGPRNDLPRDYAPKKTELGKLDVGTTTGSSNTIETNYIKVIIAGETVLEVDKYNYISNIGGTDYLADVREALGLN